MAIGWNYSSFVLPVVFLLEAADFSDGGVTSSFVRTANIYADMPLDFSDVWVTSSFVRTADIYADMPLDFSDGGVTSSLIMFPQILVGNSLHPILGYCSPRIMAFKQGNSPPKLLVSLKMNLFQVPTHS